MKRHALYVFSIVFLSLVFGGCARNKLTPKEAMSVLLRNPPGSVVRTISKTEPVTGIDPAVRERLERLKTADFLDMSTVQADRTRNRGAYYLITPKSRLIPFIVRQDDKSMVVKFADIVISRITGIKLKGNEADVTYVTRLVLTPVGRVFAPISNPSPGPNHATLRRTDGRWN